MEYKRNAHEVVQRLRRLWERGMEDRIAAKMTLGPGDQRTTKGGQVISYEQAGDNLDYWDRVLAGRRDLEDDGLPVALVRQFDQGLYGACLGADILFLTHEEGYISSMSKPLLPTWDGLDRLAFDEEDFWIRELKRVTRKYVDHARGRYGVAPIIVIDALNLMMDLRGAARAFLDVYDFPEETRRVMELGYALNVRIQVIQREIIGRYEGGVFESGPGWAPNQTMPFSVDAYHMCRPEVYEEFGETYIQRLIDDFGGGALHLHGNGRQLLPYVKRLRHLVYIAMGDDVGFPSAFSVAHELKRRGGDVPLTIACEYDEFRAALRAHTLPGGVLYNVSGVPSVDEANRLMEKVRAYRC